MDFLIHWPPGPVVATVQCQEGNDTVNVQGSSMCLFIYT